MTIKKITLFIILLLSVICFAEPKLQDFEAVKGQLTTTMEGKQNYNKVLADCDSKLAELATINEGFLNETDLKTLKQYRGRLRYFKVRAFKRKGQFNNALIEAENALTNPELDSKNKAFLSCFVIRRLSETGKHLEAEQKLEQVRDNLQTFLQPRMKCVILARKVVTSVNDINDINAVIIELEKVAGQIPSAQDPNIVAKGLLMIAEKAFVNGTKGQTNSFETAQRFYNKIIEIASQSRYAVIAGMNCGEILNRLGNSQAERMLEAALELSAELEGVRFKPSKGQNITQRLRYRLAVAYEKQGKIEDAKQQYQFILDNWPDIKLAKSARARLEKLK